MIFLRALFVLFTTVPVGCGANNALEPYADLNKEQEARKALDAKDWDAAILLYEDLKTEEPERFDLYTLHATCLAGSAGIAILDVLLDQIASAASGATGGGVLGLVSSLVPEGATSEDTNSLNSAIELLDEVPDSALDDDSELSAAILLQLTLYSSIHAAMVMDQVLGIDANGTPDPAALEDMTPAEAASVIDALLQAGSVGDPDSPLTQAMAEAAAEINAAEGATTQEKLENFLNAAE